MKLISLTSSGEIQERDPSDDETGPTDHADEDGFLYFKVDNILSTDLYDWSNGYVRSDSSPKIAPKRRRVTPSYEDAGTPSGASGGKAKTGRVVKVNEEDIALFRFGDEVLAVKEKCPHQGGPLHLGDIEVLPDRSVCVRCPWHNWCVDLTTGNVRRPRGKELGTSVYPTKVDDDKSISVGFPKFSSRYFQGEEDF